MSVRGNAAPRGMTAHDRIRLTGPFADFTDSPGREANPPGLTIFRVGTLLNRSTNCLL
jgi:hypothetical protein